jgi:hypothetical protein
MLIRMGNDRIEVDPTILRETILKQITQKFNLGF